MTPRWLRAPVPPSGAAMFRFVGKVQTIEQWHPVYVTSIEGVDETLAWLATDEVLATTDGIRDKLLDARLMFSFHAQVQAYSDFGEVAS